MNPFREGGGAPMMNRIRSADMKGGSRSSKSSCVGSGDCQVSHMTPHTSIGCDMRHSKRGKGGEYVGLTQNAMY